MMALMKAYYLFGKTALPRRLDEELTGAVAELQRFKDREEYLRAAYDMITRRFESGRAKTFFRLTDLLATSTQDLWNRSGFLHCTNQNYLLTLLVLKGGLFTKKDVKPYWTRVWLFSPHQYLRIRISQTKTIDVDCGARHYGVPFGQHAHGFNTTRLQ